MAEHPDWGAKQVHEEVNRRVMEAVASLKTAAAGPVNVEDLGLQELLEFKLRVVDQYGGLGRVEALVKALKMMQCQPAESDPQGTEVGGEGG